MAEGKNIRVVFNLTLEREHGDDVERIEIEGVESLRGIFRFLEERARKKGWIVDE